jgi:alpha-tubulin suppressor-like RCC1 family protein
MGYYREAAILYHLRNDAMNAASVVQSTSAQKDGNLHQPIVNEGLVNTKWSTGTTNAGKANVDGSFSITTSNPELDKSVVYCSKGGITVVSNTDLAAFRCGTELVAGPAIPDPGAGGGGGTGSTPTLTTYLAVFGTNHDGAVGVANTNYNVHAWSPAAPALINNKAITSTSAGSYHGCSITENKIYCSGSNWYGESGGNPRTAPENQYYSPNLVDTTTGDAAGKTFTKVSAGGAHTCVLDTEGQAYCWGGGDYGELGSGVFPGGTTYKEQYLPVAVKMGGALTGKKFADISAGYRHTCAVTTDGEAYCWGKNDKGGLGDGTGINAWTPVRVGGALLTKSVTKIATNSYGYNTEETTCAIAEGKPYCWGKANRGQMGDGVSPATHNLLPVATDMSGVLSGKTVTDITLGNTHVCALADAQVYCWGGFNNLGDGSTADANGQYTNGAGTKIYGSFVPTKLAMPGALAGQTVKAVSAGSFTSYLIASDDKVYAWGRSYHGSLGDGSTNDVNRYVAGPIDYSGILNGKKVTSISGGGWLAYLQYEP